MHISTEDLRRLQRTELGIATAVRDLCARHGLACALLGGSALGARRHAGFIPWDDDMDMGMLRADFDRFIEIARRELPTGLYVQYWLDDPHMGAPFAKVRLDHTVMLEHSSSETGGHKGISIDIFSFDNVPNGLIRHWWELQLKFWKRLVRHQTGYAMRNLPLSRRAADLPIQIISRLVPKQAAKRTLHSLMTRFRSRPSDRVIAVGGAYDFTKDTLHRSWVADLEPRSFEGMDFPCPTEIDAYLTHMYGDFMALPPLEQRRNKHVIVKLDFGPAAVVPA